MAIWALLLAGAAKGAAAAGGAVAGVAGKGVVAGAAKGAAVGGAKAAAGGAGFKGVMSAAGKGAMGGAMKGAGVETGAGPMTAGKAGELVGESILKIDSGETLQPQAVQPVSPDQDYGTPPPLRPFNEYLREIGQRHG